MDWLEPLIYEKTFKNIKLISDIIYNYTQDEKMIWAQIIFEELTDTKKSQIYDKYLERLKTAPPYDPEPDRWDIDEIILLGDENPEVKK